MSQIVIGGFVGLASMGMTWEATPILRWWVGDGAGHSPILQQKWHCRDDGSIEWRAVPVEP